MTEEYYDPEKRFKEKYGDLIDPRCEISTMKGWDSIVDNALYKIGIAVRSNIDEDDELTLSVVQIKEKFGGLRIYTDFTDDKIEKIINDAEEEASRTCEYCGSQEGATLFQGAWLKTLCKECNDKR